MDLKTWPVRDRDWVARYRSSMAGKNVPAAVLEEREHELLEAVHEAGLPAAELFGGAHELAAEDVAELSTVDEAVRTSEGGGLQPAFREVGGTMTGLAVVAVLSMSVRSGWRVDVDAGAALIAASVAVVFVGWAVGRAFFVAGRPAATVVVLVTVLAVALAGIASAAHLGPGLVLARDVPVPLLGLGLLAPGLLVLVAASRMPQPTLRESWDDAEWLRRFEGGLRSRLVPAATVRGHVAEVEQTIRSQPTASAFDEFGHPLVLARQLAQADRRARARRWWVSTVAGAGVPLVITASILSLGSWGVLTVPVVAVLLLGAVVTLAVGWGDRPWSGRR